MSHSVIGTSDMVRLLEHQTIILNEMVGLLRTIATQTDEVLREMRRDHE